MKKHFLLLLMLVVTLLTARTIFLSVRALQVQHSLTESMLTAYISDMAGNFNERMSTAQGPPMHRGAGRLNGEHHQPRRPFFLRMFSMDPAMRSGGVILFDRNRRIVGGSEGAERLENLWNDSVRVGVPTEVTDSAGTKYQVIVQELENGNYVLIAASKAGMLNSISRVWSSWIVAVILSSLAVLLGIVLLWRYLVLPIRRMVTGVSALRWGKARLDLKSKGLYEVTELASVMNKAADYAIEKEELHERYVSDIVRAQEDERRKLARELHDGPLQSVVAAIKRVQLARSAKDDAARRLEEAEEISQHAADEIRDYCDNLSPSWLALGVSAALEAAAERLSAVHNVIINLDTDGRFEGLNQECALALLRITQEAISNSARHGRAKSINIILKETDNEISLEIADDGRGFEFNKDVDFERLRLSGHRGLANMKERVLLLRGKFECVTSPGSGCVLKITIPANPPRPSDF